MRGKEFIIKLFHYGTRITPAHAGKSSKVQPSKSLAEDHPRTCGEKLQIALLHIRAVGSPPHMRGKVLRKVIRESEQEDHPRTCGEKNLGRAKQV